MICLPALPVLHSQDYLRHDLSQVWMMHVLSMVICSDMQWRPGDAEHKKWVS